MAAPLLPCPQCSRHIRRTEQTCPFCRAEVGEDLASRPAVAWPTGLGKSRAAMLVASAAAIVACGKETKTIDPPKEAEPDVFIPAPPYGAVPVPDPQPDIPPLPEVSVDAGPAEAGAARPFRAVPPYGVPRRK